MGGLRLQVEGLDSLRRRLGAFPTAVTNEVDAEITQAAEDFETRAINDAPRDEGILIQGISKARRGVMDQEIVSAAPYSAYVEFGTRRRVQVPDDLKAYAAQFKGTGSGGGEGFFEHILDWVKRKGIRFESASTYKSGKKKGQHKLLSVESTAWFIYHHLLLVGVRPQPFFFKQRAAVMEALKNRIEPAVKKALRQ